MAITAKNIEEQIEQAIKTLLEADAYISDNNIDVRQWFDVDDEVEGRQVVVHANSASPSLVDETGQAREYEVKIDLLSYIHNTVSETPSGETDTLYQILVGFSEQVTIAQIESLITMTINGKFSSDFGENYDERFYTKASSFTLFVE